ncbi:MAG TPA: hypothetical protein VNG69_11680 [Casimicrobiaceae bacterium]|nr:hypothetical protein [Casimicrobiaceae bacterium]
MHWSAAAKMRVSHGTNSANVSRLNAFENRCKGDLNEPSARHLSRRSKRAARTFCLPAPGGPEVVVYTANFFLDDHRRHAGADDASGNFIVVDHDDDDPVRYDVEYHNAVYNSSGDFVIQHHDHHDAGKAPVSERQTDALRTSSQPL